VTLAQGLVAAFQGLVAPEPPAESSAVVLRTVKVPELPQARVGKDARGLPAVVVAVTDAGSGTSPVIQLTSFSYRPRSRCVVLNHDGGTSDTELAVLLCTSEDAQLHLWFLRTVGALLGELTAPISQASLDVAVERLVRLFASLAQPPSGSVQGLWGELLLIAHARDPLTLLRAWHADPLEVHDFIDGTARVEVKTCVGTRREHHFSLEQLMCPDGVSLAVASVLIHPSPAGASISDLVEVIEVRIGPGYGLVGKLHDVIGATVGRDWRLASDQRYLVAEALATLNVFDARLIPRVSADIPPEVRDVRFTVEMWDVPALGPDALSAIPLWSAFPPPRGQSAT
jgi:hypothetical protein